MPATSKRLRATPPFLLSARVQARAKVGRDTTLWLSVDGTRDSHHKSATYLIAAPYNQGVSSRVVSPRMEGRRDKHSEGLAFEFKTGLGATGKQFADFSNSVAQDSHELRLSNSDAAAAVQWVAGAFLYKELNRNVDFTIHNLTGFPGSYLRFQQNPARADSQALFGQGSFSLSPGLRLTAGARYTHDEKSRVGMQTLHPSPAVIVTANDAAGSWNKATWKLGLDYDLSQATLLYANLATGYKAGGYNDGTAATNADLLYRPETVTSVEAGVKGRFLNNRLRLSAGLFFYDYTNLQVSSVVDNLMKTFNAGKAQVSGAEVEGKWQLSAQGRLSFALSLLDAHYTRNMLSSGDGANNTDFSGKKLDKAPASTVALGYQHGWELASGAAITAGIHHRYSARYHFTDPGTPTVAAHQIEQKAFGKTDLNLSYSAVDDRWSVQAWVRNLENRTVITGMFMNVGANYAYLGEPRTFGLRLATRF